MQVLREKEKSIRMKLNRDYQSLELSSRVPVRTALLPLSPGAHRKAEDGPVIRLPTALPQRGKSSKAVLQWSINSCKAQPWTGRLS